MDKNIIEAYMQVIKEEQVTKTGHFYVNFVGTGNGKWISANDAKSAKWIWAKEEGINSIGRIKASKKGPRD